MYRYLTWLSIACAALVVCSHAASDSSIISSCELSDEDLARILELSFEDFDQNPDDGWRPYYDSGCYGQAAALLTKYISRYPDRISRHYMLPFHAGQMFALNNEYEKAESWMKKGYSPNESKTIDWNAFVDANIAFVRKDRTKLLQMRERIARQPAMTKAMGAPEWAVGRKMNLDVVDGFIRCFDEPYTAAYGSECRGELRK